MRATLSPLTRGEGEIAMAADSFALIAAGKNF